MGEVQSSGHKWPIGKSPLVLEMVVSILKHTLRITINGMQYNLGPRLSSGVLWAICGLQRA